MKNGNSTQTGRSLYFTLVMAAITLFTHNTYAQSQQPVNSGNAGSSKAAINKDAVEKMISQSNNVISFTENKGQWPAHVLYRADVTGGQMLATPQGMLVGAFDRGSITALSEYNMKKEQIQAGKLPGMTLKDLGPSPGLKGFGWRLNFLGGTEATAKSMEREGESKDVSNFFNMGTADASGVHGYNVITYKDVYQGVNVKYYTGKDGSLENDIIVKPGADASKINMQIEGIDELRMDKSGALILPTTVGNITIPSPVAYLQDANGNKTAINVKYHRTGKNSISFDIPAYDKTQTLVIDPIVMRWATWISSTSNIDSHCHGIDLNASGNIYVVSKYGTGLITIGAFQTTNPGSDDILAISEYQEPAVPGGSGVRVWQTYLGGANTTNPYAVNVSSDGYLYIVGITNDNLDSVYGSGATKPTWTNRKIEGTNGQQVFIAKVITSGAWAQVREIGSATSNLSPYLYDVRILNTGPSTYDVVSVGYVNATTTANGDIPAAVFPNGTAAGSASGKSGYALRITSNLETIVWAQQYSSSGSTNEFAISVPDQAGHILVGGLTNGSSDISYNNPSTQTTIGGSQDGWLMSLDTANGSAAWSRYFNSASNKTTSILCMEVNPGATQFFIGGMTNGLAAGNISSGAYQTTYPGSSNQDFYVASLPITGASTSWGTYFGGNSSNSSDNMMGLNVDQNGDVYILGYTNSKFVPTNVLAGNNYPIQTDSYDGTDYDAIFWKFSGSTGDTLMYYTFLGGKNEEEDPIGERGIKFNSCRIYLAITSESDDFPLTTGALDTTNSLSSGSHYLPLIVSMANPPDLLDNGITGGGNQTITCGQAPVQITAAIPSYIIPNIVRQGQSPVDQTPGTAGAYPNGLPTITSYQWQSSTNDGSTWNSISGATGQNYTPVIIDSFVGTIWFRRIIDNDACNRASDTLAVAKVIVTPLYAAPTITTNSPVCFGDTIKLQTLAQSGFTYAWTGPNSFTSSAQNPDIPSATAADSGYYKLTVTNSTNGCPSYPDSADVSVTSTGLPTPTANASPNPICTGDTLTLSATGGTNGGTYTWTYPGGGGTTGNPVMLVITSTSQAGDYTVKETNGGCSSNSSSPVDVSVNQSPAITSAVGSNPTTCGGTNGSITISGLISGQTYSVSYLRNDTAQNATGLVANGSGQIVLSNLVAGTYTVLIATSSAGCPSAPYAGTVTLSPPTSPLAPTVSSNSPQCATDTIKLFITNPAGGATFSWTGPGFGSPNTQQNPIILNATTAMSGQYCATQTTNGCTSPQSCLSYSVIAKPAAPTAAASPNPICSGDTLTLTATGQGGATFTWTFPGGANATGSPVLRTNVTLSMAGNYTVTQTVNGCTSNASAAVDVAVDSTPVITNAIGSNPTTCGGTNGSITISGLISGQTYSVTYYQSGAPESATGLLANGSGQITITGLPAGRDSDFIVTSSASCPSKPYTGPVVLTSPSAPVTPNVSSNTPQCATGTIELFITNPAANATFNWTGTGFSPNDTAQNPTIPNATTAMSGQYCATQTVANCPSAQSCITFTVIAKPATPTAAASPNPICSGDTLTLTATGQGGATFTWTFPGGGTTTGNPIVLTDVSSSNAGNYTVTQTVNTCTSNASAAVDVTVNPTPVISAVAGTNPSTCGGSNGEITISGLTPGQTYSVNYLQASAPETATGLTADGGGHIVITGLAAASYTDFIVTSASPANCPSATYAGPVVLSPPPTPLAPTISTNSPVCSTDTIKLFITNFAVGATFNWTGPDAFNSALQNPVIPAATTAMTGKYCATQTVDNCTSSQTCDSVIVNPTPVIGGVVGNNPSTCGGSNGNFVISGLTPGQSYNVTYKRNGLPETANGLVANISGDITITGLNEATYSGIVVILNGCSSNPFSGTVSLTDPPIPSAPDVTSNSPVCQGDTIELFILNPASGASFAWTGPNPGFSDTAQNPVITNATTSEGGNYCVSQTVANCVSNSNCAIVVVNSNPVIATVVGSSPTTCGGTQGYITISGLTANQNFTVNYTKNGLSQAPTILGSNGSGQIVILNLGAGSYSNFVVTSIATGCISIPYTGNVVLSDPQTPPAPSLGSNIPCSGDTLFLTAQGAVGATYNWIGPGIFTSGLQDPIRLNATSANDSGQYCATQTVNNCVSPQACINVSVHPSPSANAGDDTTICNGQNARLGGSPTANGGTPGYTYNWSNSAAAVANPIVAPNATTVYFLTVTDANGCVAKSNASVNVNPAPTANAGSDQSLVSCDTVGIVIGATHTASGGTGPYTYLWAPPAGVYTDTSANPTIKGIGTTTLYTVTVTDQNQCTASSSMTVDVLGSGVNVVINPSGPLQWCAGSGNSVLLTADASGGQLNYSYNWTGVNLVPADSNAVANTANPDTAGTYNYSVVVTDALGCQAGATISVTVNPTPIASAGPNLTICNGMTDTIGGSPTASGGTPPYSYNWNSAPDSANPQVSPTSQTTYNLTVTDSKTCSATSSVTVNVNPLPSANAGSTQSLPSCSPTGITIGGPQTASGGGGAPYTYIWSPTTGLSPTSGSNPTVVGITDTTTYTVTVTDKNGCSASAQVTVDVINNTPSVTITASNGTEWCANTGTSSNLTANVTHANGALGYSWSGLDISPTSGPTVTVNPNVVGSYIYSVTVQDAFNCTAIGMDTVTVDSLPVANAGADTTICSGFSVILGNNPTASGGSGGYTYDWSPGTGLTSTSNANPTATPASTTTYNLTITDSKQCKATASVTLTVRPTPSISAPISVTLASCSPTGVQIITNASGGGGAPFSYSWSPSVGLSDTATCCPTVQGLTSDTAYTVVVTDANGCTVSTQVQVIVTNTPITATISPSGPTEWCAGGNNSVNLTANLAGSTAVSFSWSGTNPRTISPTNGQTATVNPEIAGSYTYTVTVTDINNCSGTASVTINVDSVPTAVAGPNGGFTSCSGAPVTLGNNPTATGGTPAYTFKWGGGAADTSNPVVSPTSTTTYNLTVTDQHSCTATASTTVNVNPNPTVNAPSPVTISSCSPTGVQLQASASGGGGPPYSYLWSPDLDLNPNDSVADPTLIGLQSDTVYTVVVTDVNGCTASGQVHVNVTNTPITASITPSGATEWCAGGNNSITLTANLAGSTPVSYSWSATNPRTISSNNTQVTTVNPEVAGGYTYTVTITDNNNCTATASITVNVDSVPTAVAGPNGGFTTCSGISVIIGNSPTASGGTQPYTYTWTPGTGLSAADSANPTATVTSTTSYTVLVTDAHSCSATASTTINVNPKPTVTAPSPITISSCSPTGAQLQASASGGGGPPYSYLWSPNLDLNPNDSVADPTIIGLQSDTVYTVVVTDANGCTATTQVQVNVTTTPITASISPSGPTEWCAGGNNNVNLTANLAGATAVSFSWSGTNPGTISPTNSQVTTVNPTIAGSYTYTVTVTDAANCSATASETVNVDSVPTAIAGPAGGLTICYSTSVTLGGSPTASGGTPPYTYAWSGGLVSDSTPTVTPLNSTTYVVTVTDQHQCTATASVSVTVNQLPVANAGPNKTLPTCSPSGVTIGGTPSASAGTPPYHYLWTPNADLEPSDTVANPSVVGLTSDTTFTLVVTDSNGCSSLPSQVTVDVIHNTPIINITSSGPTTYCINDKGTLNLTANLTGGTTPPIQFAWSGNGITGPTNTQVITVNPDTAGTYTYSVLATDAFNCTATLSIIVTVEPTPAANAGGVNGQFTVCDGTTVTLGGTAPDSTATGGTPPYTYSWGSGAPPVPNPMVTPLITTTYQLTVTDINGCSATGTITVNVNPVPVANAGLPATICGGTCTLLGANYTALGGTPPYFYAWSNDSSSANPTVCPDSTTIYSLTVTDSRTCSATSTVQVNVDPKPVITAGDDTAVCSGSTVVLGGSPTATSASPPLTYSWSPVPGLIGIDSSNPTAIVTANTTYPVTVTDSKNCSATASVTVIAHPNPVANAGGNIFPPLVACSGDSVRLGGSPTASGGTGSYTYLWSPSGGVTDTAIANPYVKNLSTSAHYDVLVTDSFGCSATAEAYVTVTGSNIQICAGSNTSICQNSNASVTLGCSPTVTGGVPPFKYSWTPTAGLNLSDTSNPVAKPTHTTTYILQVTDANGCIGQDSVTITVNLPPNAFAGVSDTVCAGTCMTIGGSPTATGGTPPYAYNWDKQTQYLSGVDSSNPTVCPQSAITYEVLVTDSNGCNNTASVFINVSDLAINAGVNTTICAGQSVILGGNPAIVDSGSGHISILWEPGGYTNRNPTVSPDTTTTYTLTVFDSIGCTKSDQVTVFVNQGVAIATLSNINVCYKGSTVLGGSPTATSGIAPFTYNWSPGNFLDSTNAANPTVSQITSTNTYHLTVTDSAGCIATASQTVNVNPQIIANAGLPQSITSCINDSIILGGTPSATGGSGSFKYLWSPDSVNGTQVIFYDTMANPVVRHLDATTVFTLSVTDGAGCTDTSEVRITVTQSTLVANAGPSQSICASAGVCIQLGGVGGNPTASGGSPGYTYNWAPVRPIYACGSSPFIANPTALPPTTTTFYVTVTDSKGCEAIDSTTINVDQQINVNAGDDTTICAGQSVELGGNPVATGGDGNYTYSWAPQAFLNNLAIANPTAADVTVSNITYIVTVTDGAQCSATGSITVDTRPLPIANAGPPQTGFPCSGDTITLGGHPAASGGTAPYTYLWFPPLPSMCTTCANPTVDSLGASFQFQLTVTDSFGCVSVPSVEVIDILPKTIFVNASPPILPNLCSNGNTCTTIGSANPASGGVPPYTYQWFFNVPDSTLPDPTVCPKVTTTYTLLVKDSKGCVADDSVTVTVSPPPVVTISGLDSSHSYCVNAGNVVMTGVPAGGTFSGFGVSGNVFQPSVTGPGTWCITYSYTNPITGCSGDTVVCLTVDSLPSVSISGYTTSYCAYAAPVTLTGTPAGGTFSGSGVNSAGLFTPGNAKAGQDTLTYTYTNSYGCTGMAIAIITIYGSPTLSISASSDSICKGATVTLTPTYSIGVNNVIWTLVGGAQIGGGAGTFTYSPTGVNVCIAGTAVNGQTGCVANDTICIYVAQPPTANNDIANTCEGETVSIPVLVNDVDPQGYTLVVTSATSGRGTTVISTNKDSVIYTANANYSGEDTLQYTTCEVTCPDNCSTATIVVNICKVEHLPVAQPGIDTICQNGVAYVCPKIMSPTGNPLTVVPYACSGYINGTFALATDSCFTFTPTRDWTGTQTFCVRVCDNNGGCDTVSYSVVVLPMNQPPIAQPVTLTICTNTDVGINVGAGAYDPAGNPIEISYGLMTGPGAATWDVTSAGAAVFNSTTPGTYVQPYTVCNFSSLKTAPQCTAPSLCASNVVTIYVIGCPAQSPDDSIQANNDGAVTNPNVPTVINELANDFYPDSSSLTVTIVSGPTLAGATAVINANGTITYTSPVVGEDSIVYQICDPAPLCSTAVIYIYVDSNGVTHYPPIAVDDFDTTSYETPVNVPVLSNDYSRNGNQFQITEIPCPALKGAAVISGPYIKYTPGPNATSISPDTFCYVICDIGFPTLCDTASVVIYIRPAVVAVNDTAQTGQHQCININVLGNDYDPQHFPFGIIQLITTSTVGTVTIDTVNGIQEVQFCPNPDTCGFVDTFQYVIEDTVGAKDTASVFVSVHCCTQPVAITDSITILPGVASTIRPFDNDSFAYEMTGTILYPPAHGIATFTDDTTLQYTPYPGFCGYDSLTYVGTSPCGSDTGLVFIHVYCEIPPKVVDDTEYICTGDIINISVLRYDTAYNGNTLTVTGFTNPIPPNLGYITDVTTQVITFASNGTAGTVRFTYTTCDNGFVSLCDTGSVTIYIKPCPKPVIDSIYDTTYINTPDTICLSDIVHSNVDTNWVITYVCTAQYGTVTILDSACFIYAPDSNFVGNDSFCIVICDPFGCDTGHVFMTVLDTTHCFIPNAFSPNGDKINDSYVIPCASQHPNASLDVYDRWGMEVWTTNGKPYQDDWHGQNLQGKLLPDGTYYIIFRYNDGSGRSEAKFVVIHR